MLCEIIVAASAVLFECDRTAPYTFALGLFNGALQASSRRPGRSEHVPIAAYTVQLALGLFQGARKVILASLAAVFVCDRIAAYTTQFAIGFLKGHLQAHFRGPGRSA